MSVSYMSPVSVASESPYNGEFGFGWNDNAPGNIDDPPLSPVDSDFIFFNPFATNAEYGIDYLMGPTPTSLTNISVKLWVRAWCRSHNSVVVDVRLWGCLRFGGVRYDHATPLDIFGTQNFVGDNPQWYSFDFGASNPGTAASWLLSDLATVSAGGHYKVLTDPTTSSTPYCKTSSIYLEVTGDPISGNIEPVRAVLSPVLRIFRRPKRSFTIYGKPDLFDVSMLGRLSASHRAAPDRAGTGWGIKPWERGNLVVMSCDVQADDNVAIRCLETEDWDTTLWTPLYNDITVSPADLSGIARVDLGGGWNHGATGMRNQLAYVSRPIDSLYNEVGANQWKVSKDGLHVESGGVANVLLNSSFALGATNVFTSWTQVTGSGTGGSNVEDLADYLFDATGKRRSAKLIGGTTGETYCLQAVVVTNILHRLVIWYKAAAGNARFWLIRSSDGWSWNDTTGAWAATDTSGGALPDTAGVVGKYYSKRITASGATTYTLYLLAPTSNKLVHYYQAELLKGDSDLFSNAPILTTTVAVTRTADLPSFGNDLGKRGWDPECGRAYFEFRPDWSNSELADGAVVHVLSVANADSDAGIGSGLRYVDSVFYVRDSASSGRWIFRRFLSGVWAATAYDASVTVSTVPVRGTWHRIAVRWASILGEWDLGRRGISIWVDPGDGVVVKATGNVAHPAPDVQMVEWTGSGSGVANVTVDGWTLRKTGGTASTWDAGSYSVQQLSGGAGYVEFIVADAAAHVMLGFNSNPTVDASYTGIDFALYAAAGTFQVYENGTGPKYNGAGEAAVGTHLRVEVVSGAVKYYANQVLKYTAVAPTITYPLRADCSIFTSNAYIKRVVMAGSIGIAGSPDFRWLNGAVNPRMPQDALSKIWPGTFNGSTLSASGTFRKLDFSRRPGSDATLSRLMKW